MIPRSVFSRILTITTSSCLRRNLSRNPQQRNASKNVKKEKKGPKVIELSSEELDGVVDFKEYQTALDNLVSEFRDQLAKQYVLRTSAATFEDVMVDLSGQKTRLNEIAQVTFKTPQLVMINLTATPTYVQPVVTALSALGLGFNPQIEGHIVFLPVPKVSREHREALAKGAKTAFQKCKDRVRNIQNNFIKTAKLKDDVSADVVHNAVQKLMQMAEKCGKDLEHSVAAKQNELLGTE